MSEKEQRVVIKRVQKIKEQEDTFRRLLANKGMQITDIEGDGNCMFRSVSDQVYNGD